MNSNLLYPLRASAGWFANPATVGALQQNIKLALLCYDNLRFQDGVYGLQVAASGAFEVPLTGERERRLRFYENGEITLSFAAREGGPYTPLIKGPALSAYHVDFEPVLREAGLLGVDGVELWDAELASGAVDRLQPQIDRDRRDEELNRLLSVPKHERGFLLKALHMDACLAAAARMSVVFDRRITHVIRVQQSHCAVRLFPDIAPFAFEQALRFRMPDVRKLPWERVIEIRESHAGISFREMLRRARRHVVDELPNLRNESDFRALVEQVMMQDLIDEIHGQAPPVGTIIMGLLLNLIPFGPVAQTLAALADAARKRQSWVNLLPRRD